MTPLFGRVCAFALEIIPTVPCAFFPRRNLTNKWHASQLLTSKENSVEKKIGVREGVHAILCRGRVTSGFAYKLYKQGVDKII